MFPNTVMNWWTDVFSDLQEFTSLTVMYVRFCLRLFILNMLFCTHLHLQYICTPQSLYFLGHQFRVCSIIVFVLCSFLLRLLILLVCLLKLGEFSSSRFIAYGSGSVGSCLPFTCATGSRCTSVRLIVFKPLCLSRKKYFFFYDKYQ